MKQSNPHGSISLSDCICIGIKTGSSCSSSFICNRGMSRWQQLGRLMRRTSVKQIQHRTRSEKYVLLDYGPFLCRMQVWLWRLRRGYIILITTCKNVILAEQRFIYSLRLVISPGSGVTRRRRCKVFLESQINQWNFLRRHHLRLDRIRIRARCGNLEETPFRAQGAAAQNVARSNVYQLRFSLRFFRQICQCLW